MPAIVFDLDGTLVDSHQDIATALNGVLTDLDLPTHAPAEVKTMIGGGVRNLLVRALGDAAAQLLEAAHQRFRDRYADCLVDTTAPYPGIPELLTDLAQAGYDLAVATNKPSFFTTPLIRAMALNRMGVRAWACSDEVPHKKPDPAVVSLAMTRLGRTGPPLAYVGDMPVDAETARGAGCPSIGVSWGFDPDGLRRAGTDAWVEAPETLPSVIDGLVSGS